MSALLRHASHPKMFRYSARRSSTWLWVVTWRKQIAIRGSPQLLRAEAHWPIYLTGVLEQRHGVDSVSGHFTPVLTQPALRVGPGGKRNIAAGEFITI